MYFIILMIVIFMMFSFPYFRCVVFNPVKTIKYLIIDIYRYIRYKRWREYKKFGTLNIFTGLFGKGKSLSCVIYVKSIYKKYNNKKVYDFNEKKWKVQYINVVSNIDIKDIPYIKLRNLSDMKEISKHNDGVSVWLFVVDEMSTQVNSREYKSNFTTELLNILLTCRHYRIQIVGSAQRFNHVDALVRQVTSKCLECEKKWRLLKWLEYNAWTVENTSDVTKIKPVAIRTRFVIDSDYNSYDTMSCVESFKKNVENGNILTDREVLEFQNAQEEKYNEISLKKRHRKKLHK